jgi:hypothetical protein
MSVTMQKRILHTTGVSLSTMLLLVVAQVVVQVTLYFQLTQLLVLFTAIFPLIALICGIMCKVLAGSIWSALIASAAAFSIVLLVLFRSSDLIYAPLYVGISVLGYAAAYWVGRRRKLNQSASI